MAEVQKVRDDCLDAHNIYRGVHGVKKLKMSVDLTTHAQEWADHLAKRGDFDHSGTDGMGENIAMSSKPITGKEIARLWYSEILDYNFKKPGFASNTGHFTQVVWEDSKEIGIGYAKGKKGYIAVANYRPAGNSGNGYADNVKKQDKTKLSDLKDNDLTPKRNEKSAGGGGGSSTQVNESVSTSSEFYTEGGVKKKKTVKTTTIVETKIEDLSIN